MRRLPRRAFLRFANALLIVVAAGARVRPAAAARADDIILVNGWILRASDLTAPRQ